MTDAPTPDTPPAARHPASRVTRLPYVLVVLAALIAAVIWGAVTMRARETAEREIIGVGDDAVVVDQAIRNPPAR